MRRDKPWQIKEGKTKVFPRMIDLAEFANRYEVSEKTIQRDISKIKNNIANLVVRESIFYSLDYDPKNKGYCLKGMVNR